MKEGLNAYRVWKDFCYKHHRGFWDQADGLGYWRSYDDKQSTQYKPVPEEKLIKPIVGYQTVLNWLEEYDVSFKKLKTDTCDTCDRLRMTLAERSISDKQYTATKVCPAFFIVVSC